MKYDPIRKHRIETIIVTYTFPLTERTKRRNIGNKVSIPFNSDLFVIDFDEGYFLMEIKINKPTNTEKTIPAGLGIVRTTTHMSDVMNNNLSLVIINNEYYKLSR